MLCIYGNETINCSLTTADAIEILLGYLSGAPFFCAKAELYAADDRSLDSAHRDAI